MAQTQRRVTINTVADAAGVSRQTVTNALRHPERVRPDTLLRVHAEIDRLGYRPSTAAQSMQAQRSGAIGVELNALGPQYHNAMMTPFLASLSVRAREGDFHMVTFGSDGDSPTLEAYARMWRSQTVDAFVITDTHHRDPRPEWLQRNRIPFASFGRVWDDPTFAHWVDVDGHHGTARAVDHCREAGYHRIGYLGWPEGSSAVADSRLSGWYDACRWHGGRVAGPAHFALDDLDAATAAGGRVVAELGPGAAVVCASDVLAVGVLHAVLRAGLRAGVDVGIVGFDDSELARMHALSSISQPMGDIAAFILRLVAESMEHDRHRADGILLKPGLTARASTAP